MPEAERLPRIAVIGSGAAPHAERAAPLGAWLARAGFHLLTGGGGGVMAAASRAFAEVTDRRGRCIGILPAAEAGPGAAPPGYPNAWVEIPIRTHLPLRGEDGARPLSRNHLVVLSADAVVALPGGAGTASEVRLALRYGRPLVAHLGDRGGIPELPESVAVEPRIDGVRRFLARALGVPADPGA